MQYDIDTLQQESKKPSSDFAFQWSEEHLPIVVAGVALAATFLIVRIVKK